MMDFLLADGQGLNLWDGNLWYALPLIIAVSLVYAATRHEQMRLILWHAGRVALWVVRFMAVVFVVLALISWRL